MREVMDGLTQLHQKRFAANRAIFWKFIKHLTDEEIDELTLRVCKDGTCICGKPCGDHTYSELVYKRYGFLLLELCDGRLGKT